MRAWVMGAAAALAGCSGAMPGEDPDGPCSPTPVVLASMPARSAGFLLDTVEHRGFAFVSMNGVFRVPLAGGAREELATLGPLAATSPLARMGQRLYFAAHEFRTAGTRVHNVPLDNRDVEALTEEIVPGFPGLYSPTGLVGRGDHVLLLLAGRGHQLSSISRAEGRITSTLSDDAVAGLRELRGDEAGVFAASLSAIHRLESTAIAASVPALRPKALALDATHVYWREARDGGLSQLRRAPRATLTPVETLGEVADDDAFAITVTATHVYWADASGVVRRMVKAGGAPELVATGGRFDDDDYDGALAVRGDSVYWYAGPPGGFANDDAPLALLRACVPAP